MYEKVDFIKKNSSNYNFTTKISLDFHDFAFHESFFTPKIRELQGPPVLRAKITYFKSVNVLFLSIVERGITWGFQLSYNSSLLLKGLKNCDIWNLEI